jgi:hypothetical protein
VKAVMNYRVPQNAGKFLSGCPTGGLSSSAQFQRVSLVIRIAYGPDDANEPSVTAAGHRSQHFLCYSLLSVLLRIAKRNQTTL